MERLACLAIGYLAGNFLTAEIVARWRTGRSAGELGSGNPGMANITGQLGIKWGALVLLGDVAKTALACLVCRYGLFPQLGPLAALYAGTGAMLGHDLPVWKHFHGGKGVAATCAALVLTDPLWGSLCCLFGLAVVLVSGYLPLGAVTIPAAFIPVAFLRGGPEAGLLASFLTGMMVYCHIHGLKRVWQGRERRAELVRRRRGAGPS